MVFAIALAAWMTLATTGTAAMGGEEYWPRYGPFILDLHMIAEPGPQFGCNSGGSHLLSALVTLRIGEIAEEFAWQNLFGLLGNQRLSWRSDAQGNTLGWGDLMLTSPDLTRIGYLFLKKGRWEREQIVSVRSHGALRCAGRGRRHGEGYRPSFPAWSASRNARTSFSKRRPICSRFPLNRMIRSPLSSKP